MGFWQLGNTSVRSAMRIKDGLTALSKSAVQGNIRKGEGDLAFRKLLGECGVVSLGVDSTNSVGRKWRSAMGKLGFLYPLVTKSMGFRQTDLGKLDTITPAGWNLIRAETVPAAQECFLRAMATPVFAAENGKTFSPLVWTLAILLELEKRGQEPAVHFPEIALIVQTTTPCSGLAQTADRILNLRSQREHSERKRVFDRNRYEAGGTAMGCKPHTFVDYADMNIRYLKATGMVQSKGKGIALIPEKHFLAVRLTQNLLSDRPLLELYRTLCRGSELPTDNAAVALQVLKDLRIQLKDYGIAYSIEGRPLDTAAHINQIRYQMESLISEKKEEIYAQEQSSCWKEIAAYMKLLSSRKERLKIGGDTEISIPRTEAPAYLEWSLWRAFLALGGLVNKPYEVRRFSVDQDFYPVSTAPGSGPDLVAEFSTCVVVIEATLSENSRQEAMDGEPVRRHVAALMQQYQKPVYGLFIANQIDSNTAETFRIGIWYTRDDKKLDLQIVPATLSQFNALFQALFETHQETPDAVIQVMSVCEKCRAENEAPTWKKRISEIFEQAVGTLRHPGKENRQMPR